MGQLATNVLLVEHGNFLSPKSLIIFEIHKNTRNNKESTATVYGLLDFFATTLMHTPKFPVGTLRLILFDLENREKGREKK